MSEWLNKSDLSKQVFLDKLKGVNSAEAAERRVVYDLTEEIDKMILEEIMKGIDDEQE